MTRESGSGGRWSQLWRGKREKKLGLRGLRSSWTLRVGCPPTHKHTWVPARGKTHTRMLMLRWCEGAGSSKPGIRVKEPAEQNVHKTFPNFGFLALWCIAHESLVVTHAQTIQREAQPRWCFSSCGCRTVFHQCAAAPRVLVNTCPGKHRRAKIKHTKVCIKGADKQRGLDCVQWHFHMRNVQYCGATVGPRLLGFFQCQKSFFHRANKLIN